MGDKLRHVVFGTGQVGRTVANRLAGSGMAVRAVSRRRPVGLATGVDWRRADLTDPEAAIDAAKGATVLYQCLNARYAQRPKMFPPPQRTVLAAAERADALLVTLENVYGYGPTGGRPLTEDLPLAAATSKGRVRAVMSEELLAAAETGRIRVAIGRASDFFGAGVTESTLGSRVFGNAVAGKRADFIGNPDLLHTYSYVPDIATGLVTLRQVRSHVRDRDHPAGRRCQRHDRLVPDPRADPMTSTRAPTFPASSPEVAWSHRVRKVGGYIQLAFAAFWLVRGGMSIT